MSKSSPKPRASGPPTPVPTNQVKTGQPSAKSPKFYDGPTVSAKANEIKGKDLDAKDKAKDVVHQGQAVAKKQAKQAVSTIKRHPLSFGALLSTVPVVIFLSLLSVVFCPPPPGPPSTISRIALSPFGLHQPSPYSELHQTLCYPSNVYHREFLEPYIYPRLEYSRQKVVSSDVYTKVVEPTYEVVKSTSGKLWSGPIKPVVSRVDRGARKFYLTFVDPHVPYLKKRFYIITDPYTTKVSTTWKAHVSPRIARVETELVAIWKKISAIAHQISGHPVTKNAVVYGHKGSKLAAARAKTAYVWTKPRAVKVAKEAERVTREILGPRVIKGLDVVTEQAVKQWAVIKVHVAHLYKVHLEPHVGPHLAKASAIASPYVNTVNARLYTPYILPVISHYFPSAPEKPVTFWSFISDKLPGLTNIADSKNGFSEPKVKTKQPDGKEKLTRAEMEKTRAAIKEKIAKQGKKGYEKVQEELVKQNTDWLSSSFPAIQKSARDGLDRDINHYLTGLDKLYTTSPVLTRDQVRDSSEATDSKIQEKLATIKRNIEIRKGGLFETGKPVVKESMDALDAIIEGEATDLKMRMSWMDDVTQKDWTKFQTLRQDSEEWQSKYMALHQGTSSNKQLKSVSADVPKAIASLQTDLEDQFAGFRVRMGMLKRAAYDRIEAREVMKEVSESKARATRSSSSSSASTASSGRVSILPIAEAGAAAVAAGAYIGKGKDQIIDALSQASAAALGSTTTATGVVESAKSIASDLSASASSIYTAASSSVHQATRSAIYAVGATPSPETPSEHVESIVNIVTESASSLVSIASVTASSVGSVVYESANSIASEVSGSVDSLASEASSSIHQATRSIISAVGATPSPETFGERVESVLDAASSSLHSATRAASRAVGATPTPESLGEHIVSVGDVASSVASVISETASSVVAVVTEPVISIATEVTSSVSSLASVAGESVSSLASEASISVHSATRSVISAVGATPSPETPSEHLESIANVVKQGAASVYGGAHEGTRSVLSAVGATPTPESPREYIESVYDKVSSAGQPVASAVSSLSSSVESLLGLEATPTPTEILSSASSIVSVISSGASSVVNEAIESGKSVGVEAGKSIHSVTRSLSKAVGATPTPESVGEYVEDVKVKIGRALGRDEL